MTNATSHDLVRNADSLLIVHVQHHDTPLSLLAFLLESRPQLAAPGTTLYAAGDDDTAWEELWGEVQRIPGMQLFALITPPSNFCIGLSPPVLDAAQCAVLFPATPEVTA